MQHHQLRSALLALLAVLAVALAACGDDDDATDAGDVGPDPATLAPADAPFYAEAVVRPEGSMLEDFNSAFGKLLAVDDPGARITEALDGELSEDGLSYDEDVAPWLGTRAGGFITDFDAASEQAEGAAVIAVTDVEAAQATIDQAGSEGSGEELTDAEYNGVTYQVAKQEGGAFGFVGEFLVVGTEQGFKDAVDASTGESLAESETASTAREEIPDNSLFSGFVDTEAVIDLIKSSGGLSQQEIKGFEDQLAQYGEGPVDFWGTVEESAITLAGSGPAPEDGSSPSDLLSSFPADAWFAFASADVGKQIQTGIDQFEASFESGLDESFGSQVPRRLEIDPAAEFRKATGLDLATDFDWIGDVGGFVQGTSILGLGGGLVIEATDEKAAATAVDKLGTALGKERSVQVTETGTGFRVQPEDVPVGAEVVVEDGRVVLAAGAAAVDDVLSPSETLEDSDRFNAAREALGEDMTASFFVDFAPVIALIESSGSAASDPDYQMAKPYLDSLDYLVAGSRIDGDRATGGIVLGVKEAAASDEEEVAATIVP